MKIFVDVGEAAQRLEELLARLSDFKRLTRREEQSAFQLNAFRRPLCDTPSARLPWSRWSFSRRGIIWLN
ncbi:hypothetical protein [Mycoplana rhizolycopersici]|uniref:Uncharacterized protein n=1 Tax=Mycoplana rhizolycopersici TaxID=2746702 RepID=A0ABX2QL65_9HYPH|nr:hypothetical protein [Rhizobium rhizolycopersici]NVP58523.1 hypothetical protein [Rhizobium rhizolycopersici]